MLDGLDGDTCDDILRIDNLKLPKLVVGPPASSAKRACDQYESAVKSKRARSQSEVTGSATAADGTPAMPTGLTATPCATDVSAVARRKTRGKRASSQAILPPCKSVCFAHSCPPLCEEAPDGEQSDDETHQARHGRCETLAKGRKTCRPRCSICVDIHECPRCSFKLQLPALQQRAAFDHGGSKLTWIAERKRSWPGGWAVGCILCYNLAQSLRKGDIYVPGHTVLLRGCSSWSRFLHDGSLQKADVTQHAQTELHQTALRFYLEPGFGLPPVVGDVSAPAILPRVSADLSSVPAIKKATAEHPFGPGVPQPDDYLRVWGHIRKVSSQRACKEHRSVDRYSHDPDEKLDDKDGGGEPQRELSQIAFVMAEVVRTDDRNFLRKATDCTLSMDASSSKNVITFTAACATDDVVQTRQGLIGIIDEQGETAPDVSAGAPGEAAGGEDDAEDDAGQGIDPIAEVRRKKANGQRTK